MKFTFPNPLTLIAGLSRDAIGVFDEIHHSVEEKAEEAQAIEEAKLKVQRLLFTFKDAVLNYESQLLDSQASIIIAEAKGESWLQRNWRPITMLTFVFLIFHNSALVTWFGLAPIPIEPDLWDVIKIGLGGYVVGRSGEKIYKEKVKKDVKIHLLKKIEPIPIAEADTRGSRA